MSMVTKFRVVQKGRIVAHEYVKDGRWYHVWVAEGVEIADATRITGDREQFTGRLDDDDTEIYENDRVGWPNEPRSDVGVVVWSEEWYGWSICHGEVVDNFSDWGGSGLTVIGRHEDTNA